MRDAWLAFLAVLPTMLGCRDIDRFDTSGAPAYCGSMVSAPFLHEALIPDGTPPNLGLRLEIRSDSLASAPGTLTTNDRTRGFCAPEPLFLDAPLRTLSEAAHDSLSSLEFGEGQEHNVLAWVDSSCQGTFLAVISLLKNDDVELRLLKPAAKPLPEAPATERPGFGIFPLSRREAGCGF